MTDPCKDCKAHAGIERDITWICKKLEEKEKISNIKFEALYEATKMAKAEMDRRLEGMNEFRAQLARQAGEFMSREQIELMISKVELKIEALQTLANQKVGSSRWSDHIITVLISLGAFTLARLIFKF